MIRTCSEETPTFVSHSTPIPQCCPVSGNPLPGSKLTVCYRPDGVVFPVEDLAAFVCEYIGGRGDIRGMEEMIQELAVRVRDVVSVPVRAYADLIIQPPFGGDQQTMRVSVRSASPSDAERHERAVPGGWQLVPKEPTAEMVGSGIIAYDGRCESSYRAMLAVAPHHLAKPVDGEPSGWIQGDEFTYETETYEAWISEGKVPEPFYFSAVSAGLGAGTVAQRPVAWFNLPNDQHGYQQVSPEFEGVSGTIPLYAAPPAAVQEPVAVREALHIDESKMTPEEFRNAQFMGGIGDEEWD